MNRRSNLAVALRVALVIVPPVVLLLLELFLNKTNLNGWELALWSILLAGIGGVLGQQIEIEKRLVHEDDRRKADLAESRASIATLLTQQEQERTRLLVQHEGRMNRLVASGHANLQAHGNMTRIIDHYASIVQHASERGFDKDVEVLFAERLLRDAEQSMKLLAEEHRYQLEVRSPADQYTARWIEMLDSMIGQKGEFKTITNAVVWSGDHLGFQNGTSSYLNKQVQAAVHNGFRGKRLFVVPDASVLRDDPTLATTLQALFQRYKTASEGAGALMQARVLEVDRQGYIHHFVRTPKDIQDAIGGVSGRNAWSGNFGVWMSEGTMTVNLVRYHQDLAAPKDPAIEAICFLCSEKVAQICSEYFDELWKEGISCPLADYLERLNQTVALRARTPELAEVVLTPATKITEGPLPAGSAS